MANDSRSVERELEQFFQASRPQLLDFLRRKFPRLKDEADDLVQQALVETLQRVRHEGFRPDAGWGPWLRAVASHRAVDRLRQWERRTFCRLARAEHDSADSASAPLGDSSGWEPVAPGPGAPTQLAEAERRARQGLLLSQILTEFCRWCEGRADRTPLKEAYERSLRGQRPALIAAALGVDRARVDLMLKRARDWVLDRVRQADVDRSVFLTLHRRKPE